MLKHNPSGLGHPYRYEPDQRIPVEVIAGHDWQVRARTDELTMSVELLLTRDNETSIWPLVTHRQARSEDHGPYGATAKFTGTETHLADAAARSGEYPEQIEWEVSLPPLSAYEKVSYQLRTNADETSEKFACQALVWSADENGFLQQLGDFPDGITASDVELLKDSDGGVHRLKFSLPMQEEDHVVGFGERFHSVDQRGEFVDACVYEEYKGQGHRTYLPAPFGIIIGSNYGFYLQSANPSRFDVGVSSLNKLQVEIDVTPHQNHLGLKGYCGKPAQILKKYMREFALPDTPPEWIYSLWASSNEWNTQERVQREIRTSQELGIDIGVVVIEAWSDESTFTVFRDAQYEPNDGARGHRAAEITYPENGAWPNPKMMIHDLHANDTKLLLWQIPILKDAGEPKSQAEANWNFAIENDFVVRDAHDEPYKVRGFWFHDGLLPDLTQNHVRKWWADQRRYLVEELEVDGFKTDGGEHAWGADLKYLNGLSGLEMNNRLPVAYAQTFHELFADIGKKGATFSRAGFAGSSSFPTFWAGDEDSTWEAFRASIRAGISASASGLFFWGWDIGGFSGQLPTTELYIRGTQMATFCPIMQFHSEYNHHRTPSNDRSPWNIAKQSGDSAVLALFRTYLDIRKKLIPYLAREGKAAIESGRPLMAGLFFDYPEDPEIWKATYQYMLGRDLLVAPVTDPNCTTMKIYLPQGSWIELWDGDEHQGGKWIDLLTPLERIPVFINSDSIDLINVLR